MLCCPTMKSDLAQRARFTALLALAPLGRCHLDDETVSRDAVRLRPGDTVRLNLQLAVR